jgi:adenylosuccinate lyase
LIAFRFDANGWEKYKEFLHFGLTSQDINNTAIPLSLKEFVETTLIPSLIAVVDALKGRAREWRDVPMLARTHGQPATPTVVGKEISIMNSTRLFYLPPFYNSL